MSGKKNNNTNLETLSFTAKTSMEPSEFFDSLRLDSEMADVVLLVGPDETPIFAHGNILAKARKKLIGDSETAVKDVTFQTKTVIKHPTVSVETVNFVLKYMYTGAVEVPFTMIMKVASFANELLVTVLVENCVNCLNCNGLIPENAFEIYAHIKSLSISDDTVLEIKSRAMTVGAASMDLTLKAGKDELEQMSAADIADMMAFIAFSVDHRWQVLVGWMKARQCTSTDLSIESGIPKDPGFNAAAASVDISSLLAEVGLFEFSPADYLSKIEPFLPLFPALLTPFLSFHFTSTRASAAKEWGVGLKSKILSHTQIILVFEKLTNAAKILHKPSLLAKLLYRASDSQFSVTDFHTKCDGKINTLTFILLENGSVVGAFADAAWSSSKTWIAVEEAFLFTVQMMSCGGVADVEVAQCSSPTCGLQGNPDWGPCFGGGNDFMVRGNKFSSDFGHSFHYGNSTTIHETFEDCNGQRIVEYEVIQLV
ncbi:hypothetical protein HK100_010630 [Physocladia obscura]|uniref:BTB domain-containing protein n=1 Tax=Physocladia obscura TaxID=109957 RepID=A0AAD5XHG5_9FUNG|nr:hypothetical protein HK100_010630 [Physocladia obscura]